MSHYKINERKCSTTFFPFEFIFLFHTDGGDGDGSRGIHPRLPEITLSSPFPVPGWTEPFPPPSSPGTTAYLRFL